MHPGPVHIFICALGDVYARTMVENDLRGPYERKAMESLGFIMEADIVWLKIKSSDIGKLGITA